MAPEGVMRHVKKMHGSKLVSMYKALPVVTATSTGNSSSNTMKPSMKSSSKLLTKPSTKLLMKPSTTINSSASHLAAAFTNRLNVSKHSLTLASGKAAIGINASSIEGKYRHKVAAKHEDVLMKKDDGLANLVASGSGIEPTGNSTSYASNKSQAASVLSTSSNSSGISSSSNSNSSSSSSFSKSSKSLSIALMLAMAVAK